MTSLVFGRLRVKTRKRPGKGDLNHKAFLQSSAGGKKKSKFKTRSAPFYCLSTRHGILFVWFLYSKWFQVEDLKFGAYRISKRSNKWKQNKQKERIPAWKTREQFYRALPALRNTKMTVWQASQPGKQYQARQKGTLQDTTPTAIRFRDCSLCAYFPICIFIWSVLHPFQTRESNYKF